MGPLPAAEGIGDGEQFHIRELRAGGPARGGIDGTETAPGDQRLGFGCVQEFQVGAGGVLGALLPHHRVHPGNGGFRKDAE